MKPIKALQRQRLELSKAMSVPAEIIKGSLVEVERVCGKPNCRCTEGRKHKGLYLSQYIKGKPHMTHISRSMEERVRSGVENYRRLKKYMNELSAVNLELVKRER